MISRGVSETHQDTYLKYLGVLGLLGECSVYVPEDVREMIEQAFEDACRNHPLKYKRVLDRLEIVATGYTDRTDAGPA